MKLTYGPRTSPLPPPYELRVVEKYAEPRFSALSREAFSFSPGLYLRDITEEPAEQRDARSQSMGGWRLRVGVYVDDALVGWSYGWQDHKDGFYMAQSAVLPEHRRRGLYRAMVDAIVAITRERGFFYVHSKHICTNRPILIAKMQAGFYITGMSMHPAWGVMALMEMPLTGPREEALLARSGIARPTERIAHAFRPR